MTIEKVDETNFLLYAAKHYDNPHCYDTVEFYEDLNRFKYIKRLLNKYEESGDIKDRLIINHLTVIYNVFGVEAGTRLLFLKLREHLHLRSRTSVIGSIVRVRNGLSMSIHNFFQVSFYHNYFGMQTK